MIRVATAADIPALLAMGTRFREGTPYRDTVPEAPEQWARLYDVLAGDAGTILVLERDSTIVGMMGLYCAPHFLSGEMAAGEVFWWVDPDHRGAGISLLRAAERWARERGAATLQMIAPSERVEQLYARLGYQPLERTYIRRLDVA